MLRSFMLLSIVSVLAVGCVAPMEGSKSAPAAAGQFCRYTDDARSSAIQVENTGIRHAMYGFSNGSQLGEFADEAMETATENLRLTWPAAATAIKYRFSVVNVQGTEDASGLPMQVFFHTSRGASEADYMAIYAAPIDELRDDLSAAQNHEYESEREAYADSVTFRRDHGLYDDEPFDFELAIPGGELFEGYPNLGRFLWRHVMDAGYGDLQANPKHDGLSVGGLPVGDDGSRDYLVLFIVQSRGTDQGYGATVGACFDTPEADASLSYVYTVPGKRELQHAAITPSGLFTW